MTRGHVSTIHTHEGVALVLMNKLLTWTATQMPTIFDKSACAMLHAHHEMCSSSPAAGMMSMLGYFYPDTTLYRGLTSLSGR